MANQVRHDGSNVIPGLTRNRHDVSNKKSRRLAGFFRYADWLSAHPNFHHAAALLDQVDARPMELGEESISERHSGGNTYLPQVTALNIEHLNVPVGACHPNISDSLCILVHYRFNLDYWTIYQFSGFIRIGTEE